MSHTALAQTTPTPSSPRRAPKPPLSATMHWQAGRPFPLGAHPGGEGVNFAVWAPDADRVELCLYDTHGTRELHRADLPVLTDGVWHGHLVEAQPGQVYGYRVHGAWDPERGHCFNPAKLLLDPWAREVVGRYAGDLAVHRGHAPGFADEPDATDNGVTALKARVVADLAPAARPVAVAQADTVLYEVHVKGATQRHPDIPAPMRGRYAGLAHPVMLAHYRQLGITTLSLLPVHARADEERLQSLGLSNYWGYSSIGFLAPEPRYASQPEAAADEFRQMVADLHAAGLEVVLDVVYNHTGETDAQGPMLSLRGLANARYYHCDAAHGHAYRNWSGCGNTLNLSEPRVVELVVGSLRHWVLQYGVDGFRFDLAPILARGADGAYSAHAGFFAAVRSDPVLAGVKLIAEPWDIGPGGYQLGGFPPGWQEWNDQYRDTMRSWWLRHAGDRGVFAHRFAASSMQFHHGGRAPTASVNFITAHDGFTLRDLVSYDHKNNHANGEHNRDGHHHNSSWNCGVEGPTADPAVLALRAQLQRALLATLLLSQGTPMLLAGDEIGHSQSGNNNAYCQDNALTWLDWAEADTALRDCVARLLRLRRELPALRQSRWLTGRPDATGHDDVLWWHPSGHALRGSEWSDAHDRALGIRLVEPISAAAAIASSPLRTAVLLLVNPEAAPRRFTLPAGDWQARFCSRQADGAPPQADRGGSGAVMVPARCVQVWTQAMAPSTAVFHHPLAQEARA
jgi:glycogen debranching enzyme